MSLLMFEDIYRKAEDGSEYFSARELARVLGYTRYSTFKKVIQRAKIAWQNSGYNGAEHFCVVKIISEVGSTGVQRQVEDIRLSHLGMYLTVQNANPAKE